MISSILESPYLISLAKARICFSTSWDILVVSSRIHCACLRKPRIASSTAARY
uniref:Uncharacterized protein n=1 Tax=Lepeophtheirus salmonis TaxID=72036 RepID=A0A0K2TTV6_LEPSM